MQKRINVLIRLSEGKYTDRFQPQEIAKNNFAYLGNQNGIFNRYTAKFDSSISYIDTTTHYRYFINSQPVTNYDRNIINQSVSTDLTHMVKFYSTNRKYFLRKGPLNQSEPINTVRSGEYTLTGKRRTSIFTKLTVLNS